MLIKWQINFFMEILIDLTVLDDLNYKNGKFEKNVIRPEFLRKCYVFFKLKKKTRKTMVTRIWKSYDD